MWGTKPVPSLILRLEALPPAATQQERAPEASRAEQIAAALDAANHGGPVAGEEFVAAAEPPQSAPMTAAAVATAPPPSVPLPTESVPAPERRVIRQRVDVAAQERIGVATPLTRWSAAVAAAHDPCLVVDSNGIVISISVAAVELLGCGDMTTIGRHILDILALVDLDSGAPEPDYASRITPLAVLDNPGLSRSLIRVRHADGALVTLDTSSAAVRDVTGYPLGSVTFLAPIRSR